MRDEVKIESDRTLVGNSVQEGERTYSIKCSNIAVKIGHVPKSLITIRIIVGIC